MIKNPSLVEAQLARHSEWHYYKTITVDHLTDFQPGRIPVGKFGGRLDRQETATGFFHAKKLEDRWVLVDPEGYHFFGLGVNCVSPSDDPPVSCPAFERKFGNEQEWVVETRKLLMDECHFNSLGNWSHEWRILKEMGQPVPYTVSLDVMLSFAKKKNLYEASYGSTNMEGDVLPVFHPSLPDHIDEVAKELLATRDDPWLFGIFSDNEIPFFEEGIIHRYLGRGPEDPGAKAARAWLEERGIGEGDILPAHDREFTLLVLSRYFKLVHDAIRKYAPGHMFLGSRFHKSILIQTSAYEAAGPYCDVVSINLYHRWNIDQKHITEMAEFAGKPIMITEWYAKGEDSGLRNVSGAGWLVRTQRDRGLFYENFTLSLLRNPHIVGWHWFRYSDEGPLQFRQRASNKGLLDAWYNPYTELVASVGNINKK
jgi:hypothetical protein